MGRCFVCFHLNDEPVHPSVACDQVFFQLLSCAHTHIHERQQGGAFCRHTLKHSHVRILYSYLNFCLTNAIASLDFLGRHLLQRCMYFRPRRNAQPSSKKTSLYVVGVAVDVKPHLSQVIVVISFSVLSAILISKICKVNNARLLIKDPSNRSIFQWRTKPMVKIIKVFEAIIDV